MVQKCSRIEVCNALAVPVLLHGKKYLTLMKKDKIDWHQSRWNFSEERPGKPFFWQKTVWRNFGRAGSRAIWRETSG